MDSFGKIFTIIPKSTVCEDLGVNYGRFEKKLRTPDLFTIRDIRLLSILIGVDWEVVVRLILSEIGEMDRLKCLTN